ncbi:phosphatidylserine/phosphatidylglycerophosphate/cardiolipin synthase family protein [Candidatus Pacebacteria bacterium]|nr:phosphatidylserine/phosphatidylglycerophosphate/cardiolipin synthase family protein [Candidatus Paceibacterota bacterium]
MIYLLIAAGIGVIAVIYVGIYLFTSIGKNATRLAITEATPVVSSPEFLVNLATTVNGSLIPFVNEYCTVLYKNEDYRDNLLNDIANASKSISLLTYVWDFDESTEEIFSALIAAVERGVTVRLLIDAMGSYISASKRHELEAAGISIALFRPFEAGKLTTYNARVHRRAYIFDGQIGYFGGSALTKHWLESSIENDFVYDDVMYRVAGTALMPIASAFGELWPAYRHTVAQDLLTSEAIDQSQGAPNAVSLIHVPQTEVHPLTYYLWYSCMCAKDSIMIVNPYFVPGKALTELLCSKARAGVAVTIITQGSDELRFVQYAARSYYSKLMAAGVKIIEHKRPHLHAKFTIIDAHFSICGSANFDIRSQRINSEFVIGIQSDELAATHLQIVESYQNDLKTIDPEIWSQRSWYSRLMEKVFMAVSEQL